MTPIEEKREKEDWAGVSPAIPSGIIRDTPVWTARPAAGGFRSAFEGLQALPGLLIRRGQSEPESIPPLVSLLGIDAHLVYFREEPVHFAWVSHAKFLDGFQ